MEDDDLNNCLNSDWIPIVLNFKQIVDDEIKYFDCPRVIWGNYKWTCDQYF